MLSVSGGRIVAVNPAYKGDKDERLHTRHDSHDRRTEGEKFVNYWWLWLSLILIVLIGIVIMKFRCGGMGIKQLFCSHAWVTLQSKTGWSRTCTKCGKFQGKE